MPWFIFLSGICMGAADLVPGISGGTIAFIMGFYSQLLESIKSFNLENLKILFTGNFRLFSEKVAWKFLLFLGSGMVVSFISLAHFFHFVLGHELYRVYLYSAFLGLILASFWFCLRQLTEWKTNYIIGLVLGAIVAFVLTGPLLKVKEEGTYSIRIVLDETISHITNYDAEKKLLTNLSEYTLGAMLSKGLITEDLDLYKDGLMIGKVGDFISSYQTYKIDPWIIFCGSIAICAMLLPGISGSYLLTLLGVYPIIIGALADFISGFDEDAFFILLSLGIGIFLGFILFSRLVSWVLKKYPNMTLAVLAGLMIGAIRSVWPFWTYEYVLLPLKLHQGPQLILDHPIMPAWTSSLFLISIMFSFLGFFLVFFLEKREKDVKDKGPKRHKGQTT